MLNKEIAARFKEKYIKSKTWKDADDLIQTMTSKERFELFTALDHVDAYMGLDMRQDFYKRILKHV